MNLRSTGMILYEDDDIVIIVTWQSINEKTGNMSQVIVLNRYESPTNAAKSGEDVKVCYDCKHRPVNKGSCYVNLGFAPSAIYRHYKQGKYSEYDENFLAYSLKYRSLRLTSYGDPVAIPFELMERLVKFSKGITGYSHQWCEEKYRPYFKYCMASVDSESEMIQAMDTGYRTFRVMKTGEELTGSEILCPNLDLGIQCEQCRLCDGRKDAKNIAVYVHGLTHKIIKFNT